jgi:hypothetical protein
MDTVSAIVGTKEFINAVVKESKKKDFKEHFS